MDRAVAESHSLFRGRGRVRPQRSEGVGRKGHPTAAKRREACPTGAVRTTVRTRGWTVDALAYENTPSSDDDRVSYEKVAATYSPTWWGSTIGDGELNFSVRNGKRWILTAITATVCF